VKPPLSAATRVLALLGDPVSHSLSPAFQNAALNKIGLDGIYVALRCSPTDLPALLLGLARAGGGGNVTVPHKETAAKTVERPSRAVLRTGACNTFWLEDGTVHGDNTDVAGFTRAARQILGGTPRGASVLLLGAGGAARAALEALAAESARRVVILNRSIDRARELRDRYADSGLEITSVDDPGPLAGQHFDLAVNSTSLGLAPDDPLPLPSESGIGIGAALDLVYAPRETAWVRDQRSRGIPAADGLEMLLQQGASAFERWWGIEAPLEAMRAALPRR